MIELDRTVRLMAKGKKSCENANILLDYRPTDFIIVFNGTNKRTKHSQAQNTFTHLSTETNSIYAHSAGCVSMASHMRRKCRFTQTYCASRRLTTGNGSSRFCVRLPSDEYNFAMEMYKMLLVFLFCFFFSVINKWCNAFD